VLTNDLGPNQLDRVTRPHGAAFDHAGHLTRAANQRTQRVHVDIQELPACRPVAGNLELRFADAQPRALGELHHLDAFDGDVFAQCARAYRHPTTSQLGDRFGIQDADLPVWPAGVSIALHTKIFDELRLGPRQLPEFLGGVRVHRYQGRHDGQILVVNMRLARGNTLASMPLLDGRRGLIFGVANRRSIAWAIAQALAREGAELAFTFQGERIEQGVRELASSVNSTLVESCDVTRPEDLDSVFSAVDKAWGGLDILVHSVAYAPPATFERPFAETTRDDFVTALDISAYSLIALTRRAAPLMDKRGGGAVLTMTFNASQRAYPHYNIMAVAKAALEAEVRYLAMELGPRNIRVNAISAGPVRTLAARSITGFTVMEDHTEKNAPLRRNISAEDVGNAALYLCGPLAANVTGQILLVDAGYSILGMSIS
jgi:enoyl-[acyl-carrier protein] reductase I